MVRSHRQVRVTGTQHAEQGSKYTSNRRDLNPIAVPGRRKRVEVAEQLVRAIDQVHSAAARAPACWFGTTSQFVAERTQEERCQALRGWVD